MPSKMITDRQKAAAALSGTVEVYAQQASTAFINLLEPLLDEGAPAPDIQYLQKLLSRRLSQLRQKLVTADEIHRAERKEDRRLRTQRDDAAQKVRDLVLRLRGFIDQSWGAGSCAQLLDVGGRVPEDPVVLHRFAGRMLDGMKQGFLENGSPLFPGVQLDVAAWIPLLEEPMSLLDEALFGLSQERPETGSRLVEKTLAMEEYDRTYRATATLLESLFRYVGRKDLAARVRPKLRSPTSAEGAPEETEPPAPEVPATRKMEEASALFPDLPFSPI